MKHCVENKQTLLERVKLSFVKQKDIHTTAKILKLLKCLIKMKEKYLTKEQVRMLSGCLFNSAQVIRDEASMLLLTVGKLSDGDNTLLQIQLPPKQNEDGTEADFEINFVSQPNKSKAQLKTLFGLQKKYMLTQKDYINQCKLLVQNFDQRDDEQNQNELDHEE